jgi:hypothetical protein
VAKESCAPYYFRHMVISPLVLCVGPLQLADTRRTAKSFSSSMADSPNFKSIDEYFMGTLNFELEPGMQPAGPAVPQRGAALLQGKSPRMITDRLREGDPLEVVARTKRRLEWHALLMDHMRTAVRSVAYISYLAARDGYRGSPPLEEFMHKGIDEAIRSIVEEDWASERKKEPIDPRFDPYARITAAADMDPADARKLTLEFNLLPANRRRPLYAVLINNQPIRQAAQTHGFAASELKADIRALLSRLTGAAEGDLLDAMMAEFGDTTG